MRNTSMQNTTASVNRLAALDDQLQPGDLLFQLSQGPEPAFLISRLFAGVNGQALNHVGLYGGGGHVIEAMAPQVQETALAAFVQRSVLDTGGRPCITAFRLRPPLADRLGAGAVDFARQCLRAPYDHSYGQDSGWYCSQLVLAAFKWANGGQAVFQETAMSFRDPQTGAVFPYWADYYQRRGEPLPEGQPGSHPALLSLSDQLDSIAVLGALPFRGVDPVAEQRV